MDDNKVMKTGTTILGIVCKDGIVMAGDNRGSVGGALVMSKNEKKVFLINDYLVMAGAGYAAEIQKVPKIVAAELKLKELRSKKRPTVKNAANLLSNIQRQGSTFLIGGVNEDGSTELYSLDGGGHVSKIEDYDANFGSGLMYVLGYLEREYKPGVNVKEGIELAKEALKASIQRDMASGNGMNIIALTKDGIKEVVDDKIEFIYKNRE